MSESKALIVRDRKTGQPVFIPISMIPAEIHPSEWFDNSYWMYRPDRNILQPMIQRYLHEEPLSVKEVKYLARYMVDHACHIAVMGFLFEGGQPTVEFNLEGIRKLREIQNRAKTRSDLNEMINVGMDYALDAL